MADLLKLSYDKIVHNRKIARLSRSRCSRLQRGNSETCGCTNRNIQFSDCPLNFIITFFPFTTKIILILGGIRVCGIIGCKYGKWRKKMVKQKKVTFEMPKELAAKIKGYSALSNIPMRLFIVRTLWDKIRKIEKGEDKTIKIEKKET